MFTASRIHLTEHGGSDGGLFTKNIGENGLDVIDKVNSCHFLMDSSYVPGSLLTSGFAQVIYRKYLSVIEGIAGYLKIKTKTTQMRNSISRISFPESQACL